MGNTVVRYRKNIVQYHFDMLSLLYKSFHENRKYTYMSFSPSINWKLLAVFACVISRYSIPRWVSWFLSYMSSSRVVVQLLTVCRWSSFWFIWAPVSYASSTYVSSGHAGHDSVILIKPLKVRSRIYTGPKCGYRSACWCPSTYGARPSAGIALITHSLICFHQSFFNFHPY